jgi:hypothetical protein
MARRTIRAQRSSPYLIALVVIFSVLFVAAAVGWGWTWSIRNEELAKVFGQQRLDQAKDTDQLFAEWAKKGEPFGKTLLVDIIDAEEVQTKEYRSQIPPLIQRLSGESPDNLPAQQLRQAASDVVKATADELKITAQTLAKSFEGEKGAEKQADLRPPHMVAAMRDLRQRIDALVLQTKTDQAAINTIDTQIKGLQAELETTKKEDARHIQQLEAEKVDERNRLTAARDNAILVQQQLEKALREAVDRHATDKKLWLAEAEKSKQALTALTSKLTTVSAEVAKFREVPTEMSVDGKIVRVSATENLAYGDFGKQDGVILGMTFSIFSAGELGKAEPQPKGQCKVVKFLGNDASELRVELLKKDNPVIEGDLLVNPVYSRTQHLTFYLVGRMQLEVGGANIAEQIKGLIQANGGNISNTLAPKVDYVILGEAPAVPPQPGPAAGPMERQVYDQLYKQYLDYVQATSHAREYGTPVYSLNKFMSLMGMAGQM